MDPGRIDLLFFFGVTRLLAVLPLFLKRPDLTAIRISSLAFLAVEERGTPVGLDAARDSTWKLRAQIASALGPPNISGRGGVLCHLTPASLGGGSEGGRQSQVPFHRLFPTSVFFFFSSYLFPFLKLENYLLRV